MKIEITNDCFINIKIMGKLSADKLHWELIEASLFELTTSAKGYPSN